jgi:DNA-binding transcriptional MerR regulator
MSFDPDDMLRMQIIQRLRERPIQDIAELVASVGVPWSDIEAALTKLIGYRQVEEEEGIDGEKIYRLAPSRLASRGR